MRRVLELLALEEVRRYMKFYECLIRNIHDDDFHVGYFRDKKTGRQAAKKLIRDKMHPDNSGFEVWFSEENLQ